MAAVTRTAPSARTAGGLAALLAALMLAPPGWAQSAIKLDPAKRDAAMRQLRTPAGVGGCVYLALPYAVRRAAVERALAGGSNTDPAFQAAVAKVSEGCTGRPYSASDAALVATVGGTFQKASAALTLALQFGVGQSTLDAAWTEASAEEKAAFYAAADEFLDPGRSVTPRALDTGPLARRAGVSDAEAEPQLRKYFLSAAMLERAEPSFAKASAR